MKKRKRKKRNNEENTCCREPGLRRKGIKGPGWTPLVRRGGR
jgi:hypothetical protein